MVDADIEKYLKVIPDFPTKGISFKDITSVIAEPCAFKYINDELTKFAKEVKADVIVGIESRGFVFAAPIANNLGLPLVLVRKPGKLPREVVSYTYQKEYGSDTLCMHKDSIKPGQKALVVDDLIAIGGTMSATIELIKMLGGSVAGLATLITLKGLPGEELVKKYKTRSFLNLSD